MKEQDFLKASGMIVLGLLSAVIGLLILILLIPQFLIVGANALIASFFFLVIWLVTYIGVVVATLVVYFFKSMETEIRPAQRAPPRKRKAKRRR